MGNGHCSDHVHEVARRLRSRCEAIFGAHFLGPEWQDGGHGLDRVQWYMAGRAAPLGAVTAPVAASVFGTIAPGLVAAGLSRRGDSVWPIVTPEEVAHLKLVSAVAVLAELIPTAGMDLERAVVLLGRALAAAETAGHPLYAGLSTFPEPPEPAAYLWRLCDMMREHRSDAHVTAWRSFGLDPVEINVLNELWRDVRLGAITGVNMGWDGDAAAAALGRLTERGLAAGATITPTGRDAREEIERITSAQQASVVDALGSDADELLGLLDPWARTVAAAG